jgi:fructokinase
MRRLFTIGETVLDLIFKNNIPIKANPGGSMLNATVTLGRLNLPVYFLSEFTLDLAGNMISSFLRENGINCDYVYLYKDGHTTIAIAFLDENNNASYNFYKVLPLKRFDIEFPQLNENDIFLFGSFLCLDKGIRAKLAGFLSSLKENNVLKVYDPNFRKAHLHELSDLLPFIKENISFADIVKGSDEDFRLIFNAEDPEEIYHIVRTLGCKNLILTCGGKDVILKTDRITRSYPVKKIEIKSTIGAGDNFNAGILYSLYTYDIDKFKLPSINTDVWDKIIDNSILFAQNVCESYDNYIDKDFHVV